MRIAILGATSQIARDLIVNFAEQSRHELTLFARRPESVLAWLDRSGMTGLYSVFDFDGLQSVPGLDAIINFVGSGNPAQTAAMGASIFDVTHHHDQMALDYVKRHPDCRYIFLSSGAAYGSGFEEPANEETSAKLAINKLMPQDWYAVAKLYAECRHRAYPDLHITDIRVFNYFSRSQEIEARYLITDILRSIRDKTVLKTSSDYIVRDFLHPSDFYRLVDALLAAAAANTVVDCYSRAPIDKPQLLAAMQDHFGLRYEISGAAAGVNATGAKPHYYSLNKRAANFGYKPALTSLEGVLMETEAILC